MAPFDINKRHDGFDLYQVMCIDLADKCYHVIEITYNKARTIVKLDTDAEGGPPYHPEILSMAGDLWKDKSFTRKTGIDYDIALQICLKYFFFS